RTEADLYLFLSEHRGRLQREFGWAIESPSLAEGLAGPKRRIADLEESAALLTDPEAADRLVDSLLLCLRGDARDERVLEHGLELARAEEAVAFGLLAAPEGVDDTARAVARNRFLEACEVAGVDGRFAAAPGETTRELVREVRARA